MKKIIYLITILCFGSLYSCYSDRGNYEYNDINEISVQGLPTEKVFKFKNADTLKVNPTIVSSDAKDESDYEYLWTAVLKKGNIDGKFSWDLGRDKNLVYPVVLPQNNYYICLNITDRKTDVTWREKFELDVTTATGNGWIVLGEDENNEVRLDMISQVGSSEFIVKDILKDYNIPNKKYPKKIIQTLDYSNSGTKDKIIMITESGTCYLDPEELTWEPSFDYKYEMGKIPSPFIPTYIASIAPTDWRYARNMLITQNEAYGRQISSGSIYQLPINYIQGENRPFKVAPYVITSAEDYYYQDEPPFILYDIDNKRFVQVESSLASCKIPTVKKEVFPMTTGKDFVYASNTRQNSASSFILLRDELNKIWLHGLTNLYSNSFTQNANYYYQIDADGIERAELFAVHTYYYFLFYVVDNKIYQFDLVSKTGRILPIDFTGEEITFIKFNPLQYGAYGNRPVGYKQNEYRLIVGSNKAGANDGKIRMFDISERMEQEPTLYKEYSGFAKPVDIVFRERE